MELINKGTAEEIAALVLAVQGRQTGTDEIVQQLADGFTVALSSVRTP